LKALKGHIKHEARKGNENQDSSTSKRKDLCGFYSHQPTTLARPVLWPCKSEYLGSEGVTQALCYLCS
ncbi:NUSAP1 isoform 11, partial [Pan troglodytes]